MSDYRDQKTMNLPIEEFDKLAHEQHIKFPDLLFYRTKDEIVDDFYHYYRRKRKPIN